MNNLIVPTLLHQLLYDVNITLHTQYIIWTYNWSNLDCTANEAAATQSRSTCTGIVWWWWRGQTTSCSTDQWSTYIQHLHITVTHAIHEIRIRWWCVRHRIWSIMIPWCSNIQVCKSNNCTCDLTIHHVTNWCSACWHGKSKVTIRIGVGQCSIQRQRWTEDVVPVCKISNCLCIPHAYFAAECYSGCGLQRVRHSDVRIAIIITDSTDTYVSLLKSPTATACPNAVSADCPL